MPTEKISLQEKQGVIITFAVKDAQFKTQNRQSSEVKGDADAALFKPLMDKVDTAGMPHFDAVAKGEASAPFAQMRKPLEFEEVASGMDEPAAPLRFDEVENAGDGMAGQPKPETGSIPVFGASAQSENAGGGLGEKLRTCREREQNLRRLLKILDDLFGKLPSEEIEIFSKTQEAEFYVKMIDEYGV
ncbi:MAG: hypothetical protein CVT48_04290 [Thermoplasmata archaeon HGW-Thermoplasmata-1]|nr:MAG: hypothetical protein CVT48_04290 [Thermoplasmata archaeon HGW-Thermoplasmata-1]